MHERSMVVVGGGIAGLAAGCYARMNGYRATILEMHGIPGGLCTAWQRKGYTFDISMHMLMGSESGPFHRMWRELGAVQGRRFHHHDELVRIEQGDRHLAIVPDAKRLESAMLAMSPADAARIRAFVRLACGRSIMDGTTLTAPAVAGVLDRVRAALPILPLLPALFRYGTQTIQDFAATFADPFLRDAVRFVVDGPGWPMLGYPMLGMAGFIPSCLEAGVPLGGSRPVTMAVAERFRRLGGDLRCSSRVDRILLDGDRAVGVGLADGTEVRADEVVWAADGRTAIFDLLGGRYVDDTVQRMYDQWTPVRSLVHVELGVARNMTSEPANLILGLDEPIVIAGEERRWLAVLQRAFDPSLAPPGRTVVEVWYPCRYEYWEELKANPEWYAGEKDRIARLTVAELDRRWPGLAGQVEVVDVPTPLTYRRFTGNWRGSPDGWYVTPDNARAAPLLALPGLDGFHMAGQWTAPFTGTVVAAWTGRQVVEILCRRDGRRFRTSEPDGPWPPGDMPAAGEPHTA